MNRMISEAKTNFRMRFSLSKMGHHAGFSLIEMVVTMVIISVGLMGFSTAVFRSLEDDRNLQASLARSNLSATLRKALTHRKSLKNTVLSNPVMKVSVTVAPADYAAVGGIFYTDSRPYGIEIYDTDNRILAGKGVDASGAPATPVYYTTDGTRCSTPGTGKCLLACTTTVHIQGKVKGGTPDNMVPYTYYSLSNWDPTLKPDFFMIRYNIAFIPTASTTEIQKKPITGTVFVSIEDVEGLLP